jgi:transcriptional regulator with XRE-family HTH domain
MARTKQTNLKLRKTIGAAICAQRESMGVTQEKLAEAVGIATETISRFETGKLLPSVEKLVDMATYFRVPVAVFFEAIDIPMLQSKTDAIVWQIGALLENVPVSGKQFVLKVAQDYAQYHAGAEKNPRKSDP